MSKAKTELLNFRIEAGLLKRLRDATVDSDDPYSPSMSKVVVRGIKLALRELEKRS